MPYFDWTEARIAVMCKMHGEGFSAAQIARSIGAPTRNSVIGKISRLGLVRNHSAKPQWRSTVVDKPIKPPPPPKLAPMPEPIPADAITTLALTERTCKWPLNDGPDWRHCGSPKGLEGPYCAFHTRVAFRPGAKRQYSPGRTSDFQKTGLRSHRQVEDDAA